MQLICLKILVTNSYISIVLLSLRQLQVRQTFSIVATRGVRMVGSPEHRPCIPGHFWVRTGRRFWAPTDTRSLICDQHCFFVSFDRLLGQSSVRSLLTTLHAERHFLGLTSNFRDAFLVDSRQFGKLGALTGIHLLVGGAG